MGIGSQSLEFVRQFFRQMEYDRAPYVPATAYGGISNNAPYYSYGMTGGSLTGVTDYLRLDADIVARYMDYEDMDDSPIVSSCFDIYADDSSQVNQETGKSVWIECEDEDIRNDLDIMLHKQLHIEEHIWGMVRMISKYGNLFQEIVAKHNQGVIALNTLPPPTVRRIEVPKQIGHDPSKPEDKDINWDTLGFIYDPRGTFKVTTKQFIDELKYKITGEAPKERISGAAIFEGWEMVHYRLLGKTPYSPYGFGISEPARWIFKRLLLLEDSIILHRLCLRGDTNIWTTSGYKKIKDIEEGDEVYSYGKDLSLHRTRVIYKKHNGKDQIFKLKSKHRELYANATHPILVETVTRQGSGKPILRSIDYVEVKNIIPGKHKFIMPEVLTGKRIALKFPEVSRKARIHPEYIIPERPEGLFKIGKECGVEYGRLRKFILGEKWLPEDTASSACRMLGLNPLKALEFIADWGNLRQVNIPQFVDADFAMLFGFMIGDGYLASKKHKNGYIANNNVGIALGDDDEMNEKYIDLFKSYFGEGYLAHKSSRVNSYSVNSKEIFNFFILNGYIPGAKNKRVPKWVFRSEREIRLAFIHGLVDADGHRKLTRSKGLRVGREKGSSIVIEMCNKELLEDLRELCMQTGLSVGTRITSRDRKGGHAIGSNRKMPDTTSYTLHFSFSSQEQERDIHTVIQVEDDEIWDIGVESELHNFVANGVVVHNTRAPSRYAFYVDVSGVPPNETPAYLNRVKQGLKKSKFVNPTNGKMDQKYNPISQDEDFFLGVRDGKESTRVESLQGPIYDHIEDIKFFENKLFAALKVPKPFLTYEESTAKTNLSAEDARFARTILRIQRETRNGLKKVCKVHLAAKGINPETVEFDVCMTTPSAIFELSQLEIRAAELDLAEKYSGWADKYWIKTHVLGWSDDQIRDAGDADTEGGPSSASGSIDKLVSKRAEAPSHSAPSSGSEKETQIATDADTVGAEVASKTGSYSIKSDLILSTVKKNTEKLLAQSQNKLSDKKLKEILETIKDLRHTIDRK